VLASFALSMDPTTFRTEDGGAVPAVTATEMRSVDRVAVEEYDIGVGQMMEHAGLTLARTVREIAVGPVTVLAGNGGNGGGGLCCARQLRNRGSDVRVVLDRPPESLTGPAAHHYATIDAMGVPVAVGTDALDDGGQSTIVDALVGYGLSGPLSGTAAELVAAIEGVADSIVSLDVPSGVDATTGERPGVAVEPDRVHTLALPKTGLTAIDGDLVLADIGLPSGIYDSLDIPVDRPFGEGSRVRLSRPVA